MDPLSIIAIGAAVGGAAGKLAEKAWESGEKWLERYFRDHHPKAQETAKRNSLEFMNDLAQRVHQLEEAAEDDNRIKRQIESALGDPDFSALLKEALIASSRTANEEKHKILARIVSERLRCQPEGLLALTSTLACEAVKHLTPKQMRFLGIATFVYGIRPSPFPPAIPPEQFGQWYIAWLTQQLSSHLPIEPLTYVDFIHLESVSCLRREPFVRRDLKKVLRPSTGVDYEWPYDDFIQNNQFGRQLHELWNEMQRIALTTIGELIGIYVHDERTNRRTVINW